MQCAVCGQVFHEEIELILAHCGIAEVQLAEWLRSCRVDSLPSAFEPVPYPAQHVSFVGYDGAITFWSNIENVVTAATDDLHQAQDVLVNFAGEVFALLPRTVAPGLAENRSGRLPWLVDLEGWYFVVPHHGKVAFVVEDTATDHGAGLQTMHGLREHLALLWGWFAHVKPDLGDGSVFREQLFQLSHIESRMAMRNGVAVALDVGGRAGLVPVNAGVVDAELHACAGTCFRELFHHIALVGGGIDDIVFGLGGVKHVEAIVMLGGDDYKLHASRLGQRNDGIWIKFRRIECVCKRSVLIERDGCIGHDLFAVAVVDDLALPHATKFRVEAEVNEHSELAIAPLLHILSTGPWL